MIESKTRNHGKLWAQIFLIIAAVIFSIPLLMAANQSFLTAEEAATKPGLAFPDKLHFANYREAVSSLQLGRAMFNSVLVTTTSVIGLVLFGSMMAYAVVRGQGFLLRIVYFIIVAGILVTYKALFVPIYLLGSRLGFNNRQFGIVLLYIANGMPFAVFLFAGFLKSVYVELEEAARIDGCNVFQTFFLIVLPLLRPALAAVAILRSLHIWNDYLLPLLFLQDEVVRTVTLQLGSLFEFYQWYTNIAFAGVVVTSIPMMIFFFSMQRHFIRGIALGAVKG